MKYWAQALFIDSVVFACAWLWSVHGMQGAKNVFLFWMWFVAVLGLVAGFGANKETFKRKRPEAFYAYHAATDVLAVLFLAYMGQFTLAGIYAFSHFAVESAREREPKVKT